MQIRPLTSSPEDMQGVLDLARIFHAESPHFSAVPFEPDVVAHEIVRTLGESHYRCFVAEVDGQVIGAIAGFLSALLFSRNLRTSDTMFFVHPDHRRTKAGRDLLRAFEDWSRKRGAFECQMTVTSSIEHDGVRKLYESEGYEVVGFVVRKAL